MSIAMIEDLVSVLLPVHRNNPYLEEALQSLINQDYPNIEILFLDNSKDGLSPEMWNKSNKIRHIKVPGEYGLSETLNIGIRESAGVFIVRMDYDDVSLPSRVREQVKFMQANEQIGISGTFAQVIGKGIDLNVKPGEIIHRPTNPNALMEYLLYKNPIIHPTVIMRKSLLSKYDLRYNKKFDSAEDLDFWARAVRFFPIGNLAIPLLKYRIHESQYSRLDGINSRLQSAIIRSRHATWVLLTNKDLKTQAAKALVKNLLVVIKLRTSKLISRSFTKFE